MQILSKFLFNFSVSYCGGGYKRLYEYAKWFNNNGGAWFVIHSSCDSFIDEFPKNRFFPVTQSKYRRIINDCFYLNSIVEEVGTPDMYYSYGIPIYAQIGKVNWFHLSNVLPLASRGISLPLFDRLRINYLGWRIKHSLCNADIISAESNFSLSVIDAKQSEKLFLSVNGSNDELAYLQNRCADRKENIATVIGTFKYKALKESFHVFQMLRQTNNELKLIIIGDESTIPKDLRDNENIIVKGFLKRSDVIECLRKTKYYISTTQIENSYNAASEGVFFADESYISDIEPHRELLGNMPFDRVSVPNMSRLVLYVKRENISGVNLKSWEEVITDMVNKIRLEVR